MAQAIHRLLPPMILSPPSAAFFRRIQPPPPRSPPSLPSSPSCLPAGWPPAHSPPTSMPRPEQRRKNMEQVGGLDKDSHGSDGRFGIKEEATEEDHELVPPPLKADKSVAQGSKELATHLSIPRTLSSTPSSVKVREEEDLTEEGTMQGIMVAMIEKVRRGEGRMGRRQCRGSWMAREEKVRRGEGRTGRRPVKSLR